MKPLFAAQLAFPRLWRVGAGQGPMGTGGRNEAEALGMSTLAKGLFFCPSAFNLTWEGAVHLSLCHQPDAGSILLVPLPTCLLSPVLFFVYDLMWGSCEFSGIVPFARSFTRYHEHFRMHTVQI